MGVPPQRESELLALIAARSATLHGAPDGAGGRVLVGPGDDCAVLASPGGDTLLIGVDQLVAGAHFEPALLDDPSDEGIGLVARKAIARAVSDIAAMGGSPCWTLATGLLPKGFAHADALFDAMKQWAEYWQCPLVGGDIAFAPEHAPLSLTVTVAGRMGDGVQPVLRSGAQPGDALYLTGQVGGSLESGWHLRFEPRLTHGRRAASDTRTHAMIDLSDGLGRDAARIGAASGAMLEINAASLPISHHSTTWADAVRAGEDYELLIAMTPPTDDEASPPWPDLAPPMQGPIGRVRACTDGESPGAIIIDPHGRAHNARDMGWDHH